MWHPLPVSQNNRGRKKSRARQARQARRAGAEQVRARQVLQLRVLAARDTDKLAAKLVRALTDPDRVACAYDAEAVTSAVTGVLLQIGLTGARYRYACLDICDAVAAQRRAGAAGALHALAVVVPPDVRDHVRRLADAAGGAVPAWAGELGQEVPGRCWMVTDPFGESTSLMCEFRYPGGTDRHALMVLLDLAWHGAVSALSTAYLDDSDAGETADIAGVARRLGADLREIPPAEAAGALRAGVDAFLRHGPAPWSDRQSEDFRSMCGLVGLAGRRAEALAATDPRAPGARAEPSGGTQTAADRWPAPARERLVADFLASPEGQGLTSPVARSLPRDLVMICVDRLGRDPLPPGPLLFRRLVRDVVPETLVLPTRVADDVSQAMRAWARWTAGRCDLPKRLRRRLLAELEDDLRDFGARLAEANRAPEHRYAEDLPDDVICDDTTSEEVLRRRYLAVPLPSERAAGAGTLDPASPDGRSRITDLWLGKRRIPRDRWASYRTLVDQLWTGEPPEIAEQAMRMAASGLDRDVIFDELTRGTGSARLATSTPSAPG
jgi:hypothetical protein